MSRAVLRGMVTSCVLGALLVGCGAGEAAPAAGQAGDQSVEVAGDAARPGASPSPRSAASPGDAGSAGDEPTGAASLPPGDPGLDAPPIPDPGAAPAEPHEHEPRRTVPTAAMLTAETVAMTLGSRWQRHAVAGDECLRPADALGVRSMSYGGTGGGVVGETVGTYADPSRADAAVSGLRRAAGTCGWDDVHDPRFGSASVAATNGNRSMVAVSAEGVVVLLIGTGPVTRGWKWDSLVDMALGSSCPAAPDGCH